MDRENIMPSKDDYRKVAIQIKRDLDSYRLAFKTFNLAEISRKLKDIAGDGAHNKGEDTFGELESAFLQEGLLIFPSPVRAEEDGYVRVIRSGSVLASILNALRFPGEGSDDELADMLGKIKRPQQAV